MIYQKEYSNCYFYRGAQNSTMLVEINKVKIISLVHGREQ
ncbi:unnamed protein product [Amoebophrya sp. A25]|nr:unnamed protein product [Amoebophrya sp. A25]|eukprot:GSA25T00027944001.1